MLGRVDVGEPSKEPRLAGAYDADLSFRSCVARVRNPRGSASFFEPPSPFRVGLVINGYDVPHKGP